MSDYDELSALLGRFPELAIFRTFARLSAKTLLYMQADLVHNEAQLADIEQEDARSMDQVRAHYKHSWHTLSQSSENGHDDLQLQKVRETSRKLREYHSALLQHARILRLRPPKHGDLRYLKEWLERPDGGGSFLQHREASPWDDPTDLVALANINPEKDTFAMWISNVCVPWFHRNIGHRIKSPIIHHSSKVWEYPDTLLTLISNIICTTISCTLPIASISILYKLDNPSTRLVSFMCFHVLCTFILTVIVNARPVEIFAATSAFAAVQVVFIGGVNFGLPLALPANGNH